CGFNNWQNTRSQQNGDLSRLYSAICTLTPKQKARVLTTHEPVIIKQIKKMDRWMDGRMDGV
ncbi:hypothetical protein ILYODFUR_006409, partial [Ilyodon furcidens]